MPKPAKRAANKPGPTKQETKQVSSGIGRNTVTPNPQLGYQLPDREWERATELVRLFLATAFLAKPMRSQSLLLKAEPGSGKTELIERYMGNEYLSFASDLTARGLLKLLRSAGRGATTHVIATEFQKFLMRKVSTAENFLGVLTQALEEGVYETHVGDRTENLQGARIGLVGAITPNTFDKRETMLRDVGFISRVAIIPWAMPWEELRLVMKSIGRGDASDLTKIALHRPELPVAVEMSEKYSEHLEAYISRSFRDHTILRVYNRFRALTMASAVLEGRKHVTGYDLDKVFKFHPYWSQMAIG